MVSRRLAPMLRNIERSMGIDNSGYAGDMVLIADSPEELQCHTQWNNKRVCACNECGLRFNTAKIKGMFARRLRTYRQ
jgi:hypothetical protein